MKITQAQAKAKAKHPHQVTAAQDQGPLTEMEAPETAWSDLFVHFDLTNHVCQPSRPATDNLLDLLITERTQGIPYVNVDDQDKHFLGLSDHYPLFFKIDFEGLIDDSVEVSKA